jgi:hypothetical protein
LAGNLWVWKEEEKMAEDPWVEEVAPGAGQEQKQSKKDQWAALQEWEGLIHLWEKAEACWGEEEAP